MRCFQGAAQFIQFVVHEYPQSLESFCRRMEVTREPISSVVSYSCSYNGCQLPRGDNRTLISSLDDSSRNTNCKKKKKSQEDKLLSDHHHVGLSAFQRDFALKQRTPDRRLCNELLNICQLYRTDISCDLSRFACRRKVEKRFKK